MNREKLASVGVIGAGFVGCAIVDTFKYYTDVKVYDKYKEEFSDVGEVSKQDIVFVCVPTPQDENGACDTDAVEEVLSLLSTLTPRESEDGSKPVIIKSTIPPGFCRQQQEYYPKLMIMHSPEFLTTRMASLDFATQSRVILGTDSIVMPEYVRNLFEKVFCVPILHIGWDEAAFLKYGLNCFFATKVIFFNELAQICEAYGANSQEVLALVRGDGRLSRHHTDVPGHDGKLGYGGACFPKDMEALKAIAKSVGVDPKMIRAAVEKNYEVRNNNS